MTALGKILVFINLVFSLLVGGLVTIVYTARTKYADALTKQIAYVKIAEANAATYKEEAQKARTEADAQVAKLDAALKKLELDLKAANDLNKDLNDKLLAQEKRNTANDAVVTASQAEVQRRQADVEKMRGTLKEEQDRNIALAKENAKLKVDATSAMLQAKAAQDTNLRLEAQLQELARTLARVQTSGGTTVAVANRTGENPPAENIEGLVREVDPSGQLMKLSIGSDAGLHVGHTMKIFRLDRQSPLNSKYLGTVRIIRVTAHEAVAQPMGRLNHTPQVNDTVASRLGGV